MIRQSGERGKLAVSIFYTILDPVVLATVATVIIAILAMRNRRMIQAQRRASSEFTGPAEPLPDPDDVGRPRRPLLTALHKRLLVALVVIIAAALACWKLLPLLHVDIPWWVPALAFAVIVPAALLTARGEQQRSDPDGPFPFDPPSDPSQT